MSDNKPLDKIIIDLQERAKELNCLYRIQELLNRSDTIDAEICEGIIEAIPLGFQYPDICVVRITCPHDVHTTDNF